MEDILNKDFLLNLFSACFKPNNKDLLQIVVQNVNYSFMPSESYKEILKQFITSFNTIKRSPSIPVLSQHYTKNVKVLDLLNRINGVDVTNIDKDGIIRELENFIREREFVINYNDLHDLWKDGDKRAAYDLMMKTADKIRDFSLSKSSFTRVFSTYAERQAYRIANKNVGFSKKIPSFIDGLDDGMRGGFDKGDTYLILSMSGKFKSTGLRWHGYNAARAGYKVVHFQAEDTEETTVNLYDSALMGETFYDIENAEYSSEKVKKVAKILKQSNFEGGEVYLKAFEKFDSASLGECRQHLYDLIREVGDIDMIIFDYLELFDPSDGVKYGGADIRQKREAIANKMKNIAMEFNAVVLTATQTMDIADEKVNNENFVITRNHISEFKGLIKPFSGVFTYNQTDDEYDEGVLRIYVDKFRKYRRGKIIKIAQSIEVGRFYNKKRTIERGFYKIAA